MIFNLLCAPCVAAMSAIRREMNSVKWTAFAISYQCIFAYCTSLAVYQIALFITGGGMTMGTIAALIIITIFIFMLFRKPYKAKASK